MSADTASLSALRTGRNSPITHYRGPWAAKHPPQSCAPVVLLPLIVISAAGGSEALGLWTVFAVMVSVGVTAAWCLRAAKLMTVRFGPVGVGCNVVPDPSAIAIPFCILALPFGGLLGIGRDPRILLTMELEPARA